MELTGPGNGDLAYTVRRSARARYARLRLSPEDGLTVVVPAHFDLRLVPALVDQQRDWVRRAEERLAELVGGHLHLHRTTSEPPTQLALLAVGEDWRVEYAGSRSPSGRTAIVESAADRLLRVSAPIEDADPVKAALGRWLGRRARASLTPWLLGLAEERGLSVAKVVVRGQRTRWASCSASGSVSLNRALLFLPPPLVRHVLLHELCHRHQLDHSPRFWQLLVAEDPEAVSRSRELRAGWRFVPAWAR